MEFRCELVTLSLCWLSILFHNFCCIWDCFHICCELPDFQSCSFLTFSPFSYNLVSLWSFLSTSPTLYHPYFHPHVWFSCFPFPLLTLTSSPPTFPLSCLAALSSLYPCFQSSLLPPCSVRDKFVEVDLKPMCKRCYERLPDDMKRRLAKRERDSKEKKKKTLIPMCLWCYLSPFSTLPLFFLWSVYIFLPVCCLTFSVSFSSYFKHAPRHFHSSYYCYCI